MKIPPGEAGSSGTPRNILVLDAECNAATCVVQSLGRAGHRISLAGHAEDAFSFRSRFVRHSFRYPSPLLSRRAFLDWFGKTVRPENFDYILPLSDLTLYPLREISRKIPGIVLPPEEGFEWFFDKARTLELSARCGVPAPRTLLIRSMEEIGSADLGEPPFFVKLTRSKVWMGDRGFDLEARLVRTPRELREAAGDLLPYGPVLVQEYEPGDGVGIEMLCSDGRVLLAFAHRRIHEYPLTGGGSSYRVSIALPPALLAASERLVKEAGWTGVAMVEFKMDGERFSLMEVNGRFWGSLPLSYRSGIDFPRALIDLLEGHPLPEGPGYRTGVYSRRFSTDFSWFKHNLVADRSDPYTKSRPVGRTLLEYGRFLSGRDHWDHGSLSDPLPVLSEIGRTLRKNVRDLAVRGSSLLVRRIAPRTSRGRLGRLMKRKTSGDRSVRILVLCYGNICRSPFVHHLLRQSLDPGRFEVRSCGFVEREGRPSPEDFVPLAREGGVDLSSHRSKTLSRDLLEWADLILLMDYRNWRDLGRFAPESLEKALWLGAWSGNGSGEIPDPYGRDRESMRRILTLMGFAARSFAADLGGDEVADRTGTVSGTTR